MDSRPVAGLTHTFYRYPARFSPTLASVAIAEFSNPGDVVLDPYMGGGTSVLEALVAGRQAVGCDVNSLAVFLAEVKSARLNPDEAKVLTEWANEVVPSLTYSTRLRSKAETICVRRTHNLHLPEARPIKKIIALALESLDDIPTERAQSFARCVLLNVGQWALNGRRARATADDFRERVAKTTHDMIAAASTVVASAGRQHAPVFIQDSAEALPFHSPFKDGTKADLVLTSPPYPGIHILYHRWQVDGRKESAAPYWIAGRQDGRGNAYYNFADRKGEDEAYFERSLATLKAIRQVTKAGAIVIQMLAFSEPRRQLARYLKNMDTAGFRELRHDTDLGRSAHRRIWRNVPRRSWHARLKGDLSSAREVVLVHVAC